MRAKARRDRWVEEKTLLLSQMEWVRNYFSYHLKMWKGRTCEGTAGHRCYAFKQVSTWAGFKDQAEMALARMSTAT